MVTVNKIISALVMALLVAPSLVFAMPVLDVDANGQLLGASNVEVSGALYDVTFVDGTCTSVFNGCDDQADFVFTSSASAFAASQALLDDVFIDSALGMFDSEPSLTLLCRDADLCQIATPFMISVNQGTPSVQLGVAINVSPSYPFTAGDEPRFGSGVPAFDTTTSAFWTYSRWSPAANASVPEPESALLLLMGIVGLTVARHRKQL